MGKLQAQRMSGKFLNACASIHIFAKNPLCLGCPQGPSKIPFYISLFLWGIQIFFFLCRYLRNLKFLELINKMEVNLFFHFHEKECQNFPPLHVLSHKVRGNLVFHFPWNNVEEIVKGCPQCLLSYLDVLLCHERANEKERERENSLAATAKLERERERETDP